MMTARPTISVIVNTIDRAQQLATLLKALDQQSYRDFEVIVVVGPTEDDTLSVLEQYQGRIRLLSCREANLSRSRNIGLLASRGEVVAFIDDDAVPSHHWLQQLARLFENPDLDATGGIVYAAYPGDHFPGVQYRIGVISALFEHNDVRASRLDEVVPDGESCQWVDRMMGANMAFRRASILGVGGFDEFYVFVAEEADLAFRLAQAGKIVRPVKEAVVYHFPASSRNRVTFTLTGRWWLQTRAGVYYALKNGPMAGDSRSAVIMRCLMLVHGHWAWILQLKDERRISRAVAWKMSIAELYAFVSGLAGGLLKRRHLISAKQTKIAQQVWEPILPFGPKEEAKHLPIDPITGDQPQATSSEQPLRVCLLSYTYPPAEYDGVGRLTNLMARGLYERGHIVHVITHGERERVSYYDGAYVHVIPYRLGRYGRYRRLDRSYHGLNNSHSVFEQVRRLVLNEGIQIVDSPLWLYEGLVTEVSRLVPVVVRLVTAMRQVAKIHGEHDPDSVMMGDLERILIERADHLLPNTWATLESVKATYDVSVPDGLCTVVPYGIVPVPESEVRAYDQDRHTGPYKVLFVGRLEKRKGIENLFGAIPQVSAQVTDVEFVIAGADNSVHDGFAARRGMDYPTYFRRRYADQVPHVRFTGAVSDEDLATLYREADLFVAPSLYESFGLVYLEAMNYAKPVIGCRTGGVPEVIDDGVTGVLVEPGSSRALADAIVALLRNPGRLRDLGIAGRERVLSQFSYLKMAENYADVYRRVIAEFAVASEVGSAVDDTV